MDQPNTEHGHTKKMNQGHIELNIKDSDLSGLAFQDHFQCYQQVPETELYYTKHNSSIWQMFGESPAWVHDLAEAVPRDFQHHEVSVIKIPPGQTIPLHQDKHYLLQKNHGAGETWRYLIFLEDWKSGHYFEIENQPIVGWRAGDWIKFHRSQWHLGGNMGIHPFYSAQITVK